MGAALAVVAVQAGVLAAAAPPAASRLPAATSAAPGHEATGTATPVSLLMYEEVVRITTSPEGQADVGHTEVASATGPTGRALASWLWPGPLVGDGLSTVTEGAGLPPTAYPVRTTSTFPGGGIENGDLAPGLHQRAATSTEGMSALTLVRPEAGEDASTGAPLSALDGESSDEPTLLDIGGLRSRSHVTYDGPGGVVTGATSAVSDIVLLGGLVTADAVASTVTSSATGTDAASTGRTRVVGLEVAGTPVRVDGKGVSVADRTADPDADAELASTMAAVGLTVWRTPVDRRVKDATGSATASGLWVEVDTAVLRRAIDSGRLQALVDGLPPEVGAQLAPALRLAPRLVFRLGHAEATTAGSPVYEPPAPTEPVDDVAAVGPAPAPGGGTGGTATDGTGPSVAPATGASPSSASAPATSAGAPTPAAPAPEVALASGPGLPPLYSVPGLLFFTAIAVAGGLGWWLQSMGGGVLGGAGSCAHGHARGIPNLRKVR
jgi:hypothetical protein